MGCDPTVNVQLSLTAHVFTIGIIAVLMVLILMQVAQAGDWSISRHDLLREDTTRDTIHFSLPAIPSDVYLCDRR